MDNLISVIVPVYNVAEYIVKCLKTLADQTYENLEVIVVDDGSTDESGEICDAFANDYPDKVYVFHTENHGLSAARNVGLEHARGEYIGFIDSDDWAEPEMFEVLLRNLLDFDADLSSCGLKWDYHDGADAVMKTEKVETCEKKEYFKHLITDESVYGYACNKLFKRSMIGDMRFNESLMSCEDIDFCVRYFSKCKTGVYTVSELYHYRQRLGSMTGDFNYNPRKLSVVDAYEMIIPIIEKECQSLLPILQKNYLKININIIGRMRLSKVELPDVEKRLQTNIQRLYHTVIKHPETEMKERLNIWITRKMPGTMLRLKQFILKRKYK